MKRANTRFAPTKRYHTLVEIMISSASTPSSTLAPHAPLRRYYADEGQHRSFVREIFDHGAADYDRVEWLMALGTGSRYRGEALLRAGLKPGMKVLDVAIGTGLVARQASEIAGDPRLVLGLDPSAGMLAEARKNLSIHAVRATAENLPLASESFDFLSMGYALRHVSDLTTALGEFHRVLRPGGVVCILEITRPQSRIATTLVRWYMRAIVPLLSRLACRGRGSLLWEYYWDTIEACIPPQRVMQAMRDAGFVDVKQAVQFGVFSEYTGRRKQKN
jgi:demethylmenaquinone methyltransferase/2-methoxy-6-polyprenyl-1,4-benzoquinol methylase